MEDHQLSPPLIGINEVEWGALWMPPYRQYRSNGRIKGENIPLLLLEIHEDQWQKEKYLHIDISPKNYYVDSIDALFMHLEDFDGSTECVFPPMIETLPFLYQLIRICPPRVARKLLMHIYDRCDDIIFNFDPRFGSPNFTQFPPHLPVKLDQFVGYSDSAILNKFEQLVQNAIEFTELEDAVSRAYAMAICNAFCEYKPDVADVLKYCFAKEENWRIRLHLLCQIFDLHQALFAVGQISPTRNRKPRIMNAEDHDLLLSIIKNQKENPQTTFLGYLIGFFFGFIYFQDHTDGIIIVESQPDALFFADKLEDKSFAGQAPRSPRLDDYNHTKRFLEAIMTMSHHLPDPQDFGLTSIDHSDQWSISTKLYRSRLLEHLFSYLPLKEIFLKASPNYSELIEKLLEW
jgi:hypothetical protein